MKRSLVIFTLFFGVLVSLAKTEAAVSHTNGFKGLETLQNSPWDPRDAQTPSDDTAKEPEQGQAEE